MSQLEPFVFRSFALGVALVSLGCTAQEDVAGAAGAPGGRSGSGGASTTSSAGGSGATAGVGGSTGTPDGGHAGDAGAMDDAGPTDVSSDRVGSVGDAPSSSVSYLASDAFLLNPERGFYVTTDLATVRDLSSARPANKTLVHAAVHLDHYLGTNHGQDLPAAVLTDVEAGFQAVRRAGIKAIVRFQYDDGEGYPGGANDATESWMIRHIQQLAPVLANNEDVIYVVEAGFIGAWGEWHTSKNFVDGPAGATPRKNVLTALLGSVPGTRRVALRYPAYKRMFYGTTPTSEAELASGTDKGRVAHHNDCFVSSPDDVGTYQYEPIDTLKAYLADDTNYEPIGGETCAVDPRNSCATTTAEMQRFHWTHINDEYDLDVLARWTSEGCRSDIEKKLGYRLALRSGSLPTSVRPGGSFVLDLALMNDGWAAPSLPRPVFVVLDGQGRRLTAALAIDLRTWVPGSHRLLAHLRVPASVPPGSYRLALWLPDAAPALRTRSEYSIQLANQGAWNATQGDNTLLPELVISATAPGDADPAATDFAVIP